MQKISSGFGIAVVLVIAIFFGGLLFLVSKSFSVGDVSFSRGDGVKKLHVNRGDRKKVPVESGSGESVPDWKMYENEKFHYRLRCPEGYMPGLDGQNKGIVTDTATSSEKKEKPVLSVSVTLPGNFAKKAETPEEFMKALDAKKVAYTTVTIDEKTVYRNESDGVYTAFLSNSSGSFDRYDFTVSGELGEQILKTFTFPKTEVVAE